MATVRIDFAGRSFAFDNSNETDLVATQVSNGSYEAPLPLLMMATLLRVEGCFVDVGANTGIYVVMAGVLTEDRNIYAFEPLPAVAKIARGNIEANALTRRVTLHEVALSDVAGTASLHIPDPGHGLIETSASLERDFKASHTVIGVPVETLDNFSIKETVGVIKVDIEGHEHAFLRGAVETIRRDRPLIFAEVVGPAKRASISAFLHDTDYVDFRLRPDMAIHDGELLFDNLAWNHAFVPRERIEKFKEACDSCGIVMLRRYMLS